MNDVVVLLMYILTCHMVKFFTIFINIKNILMETQYLSEA